MKYSVYSGENFAKYMPVPYLSINEKYILWI